jgi:hypothetical protein
MAIDANYSNTKIRDSQPANATELLIRSSQQQEPVISLNPDSSVLSGNESILQSDLQVLKEFATDNKLTTGLFTQLSSSMLEQALENRHEIKTKENELAIFSKQNELYKDLKEQLEVARKNDAFILIDPGKLMPNFLLIDALAAGGGAIMGQIITLVLEMGAVGTIPGAIIGLLLGLMITGPIKLNTDMPKEINVQLDEANKNQNAQNINNEQDLSDSNNKSAAIKLIHTLNKILPLYLISSLVEKVIKGEGIEGIKKEINATNQLINNHPEIGAAGLGVLAAGYVVKKGTESKLEVVTNDLNAEKQTNKGLKRDIKNLIKQEFKTLRKIAHETPKALSLAGAGLTVGTSIAAIAGITSVLAPLLCTCFTLACLQMYMYKSGEENMKKFAQRDPEGYAEHMKMMQHFK